MPVFYYIATSRKTSKSVSFGVCSGLTLHKAFRDVEIMEKESGKWQENNGLRFWAAQRSFLKALATIIPFFHFRHAGNSANWVYKRKNGKWDWYKPVEKKSSDEQEVKS